MFSSNLLNNYKQYLRKTPIISINTDAYKASRGVAQLVEHRSPKPGVEGSSPFAPAIQSTNPYDLENKT